MIASSAALFAVLATLAAGQQFTVLPRAVSRDQAIAACANNGQQLAAITGASIERVSAMLPAGASGWIASWNSDSYGGACLQLKAGTITAAASCAEQHLPVCEGAVHPQPPHPTPCSSSSSSSTECVPSKSSSSTCEPESSSSSCTEFSSSSTGCDLSSDSWSSSSSCDDSSSYSCSDSVSSDICTSDRSSSSSRHGKCDPCCAGVRKLTYQAPFGPGAYLAKVAQRFTVLDVFGPNACNKVATLAKTLGVEAILVGSDGYNLCNPEDVLPYGTTYVVSRAWALNQPIYALNNGIVSAANSLYNCYGEYRAIFLAKPLSDLTFVNNMSGNVCYDRCKDKPKSCLAVCANQFGRAGPLPFKMGN